MKDLKKEIEEIKKKIEYFRGYGFDKHDIRNFVDMTEVLICMLEGSYCDKEEIRLEERKKTLEEVGLIIEEAYRNDDEYFEIVEDIEYLVKQSKLTTK